MSGTSKQNKSLFIGAGGLESHYDNEYLDGSVDEFMIFNRRLSEDEIEQIYKGQK